MSVGIHGTALCAAVDAIQHAEEKVRLLLEAGAIIDLTFEGHGTALQWAAANADESLISLLLNAGASVNLVGEELDTPLNAAILAKVDSSIIREILNKTADVSKPGTNGRLPTDAAAVVDRMDVLEALVLAGADPMAKNPHGWSAIMYGVANESTHVVTHLLGTYTVDMSERAFNNQTTLTVATVHGSISMVTKLLGSGSGRTEVLDAQDFNGKTALAHAAMLGHVDIAEKLLKSGADPRITDCRSRSPLYWAARSAHMGILDSIITALDSYEGGAIEHWEMAVHGAVASNRLQPLEKLLEKASLNLEHVGQDGWSPWYTAEKCGFAGMRCMLEEAATQPLSTELKPHEPTRWHAYDRFPGLTLGTTGTSIRTIGKFTKISPSTCNHADKLQAEPGSTVSSTTGGIVVSLELTTQCYLSSKSRFTTLR
jgi:ankyrin repeat protein